MNRILFKTALLVSAGLMLAGCEKLVHEYYDTPLPPADLTGQINQAGDSCSEFGWSLDGNSIVYTDGISFVKKIDLSSGTISTLASHNGSGYFAYISPCMTNDAVYYGTSAGEIRKVHPPDTNSILLRQITSQFFNTVNTIITSDNGGLIAFSLTVGASVFILDSTGALLHTVTTGDPCSPACFSSDNKTLYISNCSNSNQYMNFTSVVAYSLQSSSITPVASVVQPSYNNFWDVSLDSNGVHVVVKQDNQLILRNVTRGDSSIILTLAATNWSFDQSHLPDIICADFSSRANSFVIALYEAQEAYSGCNCSIDTWRATSISASTGHETASYSARIPITGVSFAPDGRNLAFIAGGRIFVK